MSTIVQLIRGALVVAVALALTTGAAQTYEQLVDPPAAEWPQLGRDVAHQAFSPLDQITPSNAGDLGLVWARDLGFRPQGFPVNIQGSPSVWDGVMYVSVDTGILALDAATGAPMWEFDSPTENGVIADVAMRGAPVVFEGDVYFTMSDGRVIAADAKTGEEKWVTQLTQPTLNEGFTTMPIVADGKLILGPNGADFGGAPGRVISMDTESGEVLWTFNTVPMSPDDPAFDTWTTPPSWEDGIGGASPWNAGSYDPVTRTVVYGTGQPTPWNRLGERRGDPDGEISSDLYTASFVGLDVDTGELKWYHQVVPGDEWDYDQQITPVFADLEIDGEDRRVALLATTTGYLVVLDADTGEFIYGHQIHPDPTVHIGYEADGTPIIDDSLRVDSEGQFNRICPGLRWAQFSQSAFSPQTGLLYRPNEVNCMNYAPVAMADDWQPGQVAYNLEVGPKNDSYWFEGREGGVSAIDPLTGDVVWEWGTYYRHTAGVVATGGNLVFFPAMDSRVRGLDATTGDVVWEHPLTTGSTAGIITYAVDGRQYVATLGGLSSSSQPGHPDADVPPTVAGNATVFVFALPQ